MGTLIIRNYQLKTRHKISRLLRFIVSKKCLKLTTLEKITIIQNNGGGGNWNSNISGLNHTNLCPGPQSVTSSTIWTLCQLVHLDKPDVRKCCVYSAHWYTDVWIWNWQNISFKDSTENYGFWNSIGMCVCFFFFYGLCTNKSSLKYRLDCIIDASRMCKSE